MQKAIRKALASLAVLAFLMTAATALGAQAAPAAAPRTQLTIQCGHPFGAYTALSPDGKFLVNGGAWTNGAMIPEINVWSTKGRLLRTIRTSLDAGITGISFHTSGSCFAVCGGSKTDISLKAELWTLEGRLVRSLTRKSTDDIPSLGAFSPDGKRFALCCNDDKGAASICLFDAGWKPAEPFAIRGARGLPSSLAFTPDGAGLICGFRADEGVPGGSIAAIDLKTRQLKLIAEFKGDNPLFDPASVVQSPAGLIAYRVTASEQRKSVYSANEPLSFYSASVKAVSPGGAPLREIPVEISESLSPSVGLAFLPDGRLVVSSAVSYSERRSGITYTYYSSRVAEHDLEKGAATTLAENRGGDWMGRPAVGRDGSLAVLRGEAISVYGPGATKPAELRMPSAGRRNLAFSADGRYLVAGPWPFELWSTEGKPIRRLELPPNDLLYALAFSPNNDIVCVGGRSFSLLGPDGGIKRRVEIENRPNLQRTYTDGQTVLLPVTEEGCILLDAASGVRVGASTDLGGNIATCPGLAYYAQWRYFDKCIAILDKAGSRTDVASPYGVSAVAVDRAGDLAWLCPRWTLESETGEQGARLFLRGAASGQVASVKIPEGSSRLDFSPEGRIVAVSSQEDGRILLFDRSGKLASTLAAGKAGVTALAFAQGGKLLAAAYGDGDLRLWNLGSGKSVRLVSDGEQWIAFSDDGYFDSSPDGAYLVGLTRGLESYPIDQAAIPFNRPDILLGRLGTAAPEAVDYYFRCYLKRLVKAGKIPSSIPASAFEGRILAGADEASAAILKAAYRREGPSYLLAKDAPLAAKYRLLAIPPFLRYVEEGFGLDAPLPEASILGSRLEGSRLVLDCRFADAAGLAYYSVSVNGVPEQAGLGLPLSGKSARLSVPVELSSGRNLVEVSCLNSALARSFEARVEVQGPPARRGDLYFIGFGESEYADPRLRLGFPRKDAEDLAAAFRGLGASYDRVHAYSFTDADCTRDSVAAARKLLDSAGIDDTAVLFIAGHGFHDADPEATYYFLTHEAELEALPASSANFELLEGILDGVRPRKKLFLMDTCESGDFDAGQAARADELGGSRGVKPRAIRDDSSSRGLAIKASPPQRAAYERDRYINQDLFKRTGAVVLSSSRGGELSYEPAELSPGENGYFTGAVLRSLAGVAADSDGDGAVSPEEMRAFVHKAVAERTGGRQHPTIDRDNPQGRFGFPLQVSRFAASGPEELGAYLVKAIRGGQTAAARELLARSPAGSVPGGKAIAGEALTAAAAGGASEIVGLLLERGADPGAKDSRGKSAARLALEAGSPELAALICAAGADIPPGLLLSAEAGGGPAAVERLLAKGGSVEWEGRRDAFLEAIRDGSTSAAKALFRSGIDTSPARLDYVDFARFARDLGREELATYLDGQLELISRLGKAIDSGDIVEMRRLIEAGAPIRCGYFIGQACALGDIDAVRLLLEKGAELYYLKGDENPLVYPIRMGSPYSLNAPQPQKSIAMLGFLLGLGVDVNKADQYGNTALHEAIRQEAKEVADFLKARGGREQ
jgi:WD40 repeat protein/ankyrin repeat protein